MTRPPEWPEPPDPAEPPEATRPAERPRRPRTGGGAGWPGGSDPWPTAAGPDGAGGAGEPDDGPTWSGLPYGGGAPATELDRLLGGVSAGGASDAWGTGQYGSDGPDKPTGPVAGPAAAALVQDGPPVPSSYLTPDDGPTTLAGTTPADTPAIPEALTAPTATTAPVALVAPTAPTAPTAPVGREPMDDGVSFRPLDLESVLSGPSTQVPAPVARPEPAPARLDGYARATRPARSAGTVAADPEAIRRLGGDLTDRAGPILDAAHARAGAVAVGVPGFGVLGRELAAAHADLGPVAQRFLRAGRDRLDTWRAALNRTADTWSAAEDAATIRVEAPPWT